jgi:di/tricarboxylate transporter
MGFRAFLQIAAPAWPYRVTTPQILSFALIGLTVATFAWGRFRYDTVSLVALLVAILIGLVPVKQAFTGFTSDVVVIIAAALVISAGVARSGVVEATLAPGLRKLKSLRTQVPAMTAATAILSIVTKNVGALTILMPTAIKVGRQKGSSVSALLMPMSFISLIAGLSTLVGTSTNIIVSQVREQTLGKPFRMFDFAPVGLTLTLLGVVFLSVAWRILPRDRQGRRDLGDATSDAFFSTEATIPEDWPEDIKTVRDLDLGKDGVVLGGIVTANGHRRDPGPDTELVPGLVLVLQGEDAALAKTFDRFPLGKVREHANVEKDQPNEEVRSIEAVVQPDSQLIGSSARRARLQDEYGVKLLAVSRSNERITERLREISIRAGDVLLVQAGENALPEFLKSLSLLPLADRAVSLGNPRKRFGPIAIVVVAIGLIAAGVIPVVAGFFGAAVLIVVIGALPIREAYGALEPEVLILIGALTPISEAVQHTGGTALIASGLAQVLSGISPIFVLGTLLVVAMAAAPFLHNAPTVLVLGPIAVLVAQRLHLNPDPFLMAVATGAGCDFLTPVGHQCNTLVMGPGGYKFGDYARLGAPLSLMVILIGVPLIAFIWPLTG